MKDKRIRRLEYDLAKRVKSIASSGAFYYEYLCTERGEKVVAGPHVTVYVPVAAYEPVLRQALRALFQELHSDIVRVKLEGVTRMSGGLYRPVTLFMSRVL